MKIIKFTLLGLTLLALYPAALAADGYYDDVKIWRGTVISGGAVYPTENIGTGYFFDANYSSVAVNGGISFKRFGGDDSLGTGGNIANSDAFHAKVTNGYLGVGFSRILQIQYGYGSEGPVFRIRSDINARALIDFFTQHYTPEARRTLGDRITFVFTVEQYQDNESEIFDNASWGVGLLF